MKHSFLFLLLAMGMFSTASANIVIMGGCTGSSTNGTTVVIYCGNEMSKVCVDIDPGSNTYYCTCPGGCPLNPLRFHSYHIENPPPGANYTKKITFYYPEN